MDEGAKFCPQCAAPADAAAAPAPPPQPTPPVAPQPQAAPPAATSPAASTAKPKKTQKPRTRRQRTMGCLVILVIIIAIIAIIAIVVAGGKKTPVAQQARDYVAKYGPNCYSVASNVQGVQTDLAAKAPSLDQIAQDAQQAHDNINDIRDNFASASDGGALGNDETEVFGAANDLKNAMGAVVAYTGNPNAATLAQFTSSYQTARSEWNNAILSIWKLAGSAAVKKLTGTTAPPTI